MQLMTEEEIKAIIEAAEKGDFQAQHKLGTMYESGEGMPLDKKRHVGCYVVLSNNWQSELI